MPTIATHLGTDVSRAHNRRDRSVTDKEKHIDPNGLFEIWLDRDTQEMYEEEFGEALAEYNAKQKRKDRKIDSYYDHVKNSQKQHVEYEMIIGIYRDKDEHGRRIGPEIPLEDSRAIIRATYDRMLRENPNVRFTSSSFHADEPGAEPHAHVTMFFVADGYKNGLRKQASLDRALTQQGDKGTGYTHTAQIAWEARMNAIMREEAEKLGYTINRPMAGKGAVHLSTEAYKAKMDAEAAKAQTAAHEAAERAAEARAAIAEKKAQEATESAVEAEKRLADADTLINKKGKLGMFKKPTQQQIQDVCALAETSSDLKKRAEELDARKAELDAREKKLEAAELVHKNKLQGLRHSEEAVKWNEKRTRNILERAWEKLVDSIQPLIQKAAELHNSGLRKWLERADPELLAIYDEQQMPHTLQQFIKDAEATPGVSTGRYTDRGIDDDDAR